MSRVRERPVADATARRGYHHGNLREALVQATKQLLADKGPQGFTLADAARRAGVSPAAPYRHFADREALLAEVARRGFEAFTARLSRGADPAHALRGMGAAYLAFAREEPGYYVAMFSTNAPQGATETPEARRAFTMLVDGLAASLATRGLEVDDPRALALQVWGLSHGVATLAASGRLGGLCEDPEAVLERGVDALVAGAVKEAHPDGGAGR
ncbi:TetR/AcrR family transcriptional regulator [Salinarimonas sp.]|uniref:TetR/AcrR family transcriptional regulator n=1 Tax=Salinarimonas sp. TaxID=2766526 RepID=UPI0032D8BA94